MEIRDFQQAWAGTASRKAAGSGFWDSRAAEFNDKAYTGEGAQRLEKIMDYLTQRGMLTPAAAVLDIGCGPGRYAEEFARRAGEVVATDVSPQMIDWAARHRDRAGLANLELLVADWTDLDVASRGWAGKFDLVFAAMCPAINSLETLVKMNQASRQWCFMSHFVRRQDKVKDAVNRLILGAGGPSGHGSNVYHAWNILWLLGLCPEIVYIDAAWDNRMTLAEAEAYYLLHLNLDGPLAPEQETTLRDYLAGVAASDGTVTEEVTAKIAWMIWQV